MPEIDLVIFDMAGTTIVDGGQVPEAFTGALRRYGIEISAQDLIAVRGASKREAIGMLLAQQQCLSGGDLQTRADQVYDVFRHRLVDLFSQQGVQTIPGVEETFDTLRQKGVRLALNTGFDRQIMELILDAVGWRQGRVDAIVCGDDVPQGRPAPYLIFRAMEKAGVTSVHRVANVGDTVLDLEAGWNAGVRWNIGVLSGAHSQERLEQAPHTHLFPSAAGIQGLWG